MAIFRDGATLSLHRPRHAERRSMDARSLETVGWPAWPRYAPAGILGNSFRYGRSRTIYQQPPRFRSKRNTVRRRESPVSRLFSITRSHQPNLLAELNDLDAVGRRSRLKDQAISSEGAAIEPGYQVVGASRTESQHLTGDPQPWGALPFAVASRSVSEHWSGNSRPSFITPNRLTCRRYATMSM